MQTYRRRNDVSAIQYTLENLPEIQEYCEANDITCYVDPGMDRINIYSAAPDATLYLGNWLCVWGTDFCLSLTDEDFQRRFVLTSEVPCEEQG